MRISRTTLIIAQLEVLKSIPEELVWINTFNSECSIQTYKLATQQFIQFFGIQTPDQISMKSPLSSNITLLSSLAKNLVLSVLTNVKSQDCFVLVSMASCRW